MKYIRVNQKLIKMTGEESGAYFESQKTAEVFKQARINELKTLE